MNPYYLGLVFTGVVALLLLSSVLFGLKRGFKKSLFRFCWLLVSAVVLLLLTPTLSTLLNSIDISGLNLNINGSVAKVSDIGVNLLNLIAEAEPNLADSTTLMLFFEMLPTVILNIIVFVVGFWVLKILLWGLWAFFASKIFDKQKRAQKKYKKQRANLAKQNGLEVDSNEELPLELRIVKKKNRFAGALIGLVTGLLLSGITLMPFIGINSIYQNAYVNLRAEEDGRSVSIIEREINNQETLDYISSFENSIGNKILTYTGTGFLSNSVFNSLASVQVNNEKVYFDQEVDMAIKIFNQVDKLRNFDFSNYTKDSIDNFITSVKQISTALRSGKLVYLLGDDVLPYYIEKTIAEPWFKFTDSESFDEILISAYEEYKDNFKIKDLQVQMESLLDVVAILNNSNLIAPFVNGEVSSAQEVVELIANNIKAPYSFAKNVVDNFYNVTFLKDKYCLIADEGVKLVFDSLGLEYATQNINNSSLKENLKNAICKTIEILKLYNKNPNLDFGADTVDVMVDVGEMLDIVKVGLLSTQNYGTLIDYAVEQVNNAITEEASLFEGIVNNLKDISSWKNELTSLSTLYKGVIQLINDGFNFEMFLDEGYTAVYKIGEGFDSAIRGNSNIITNKNIRKILEGFLNDITDETILEIFDLNATSEKTLKTYALDNIYDTAEEETSIDAYNDGWKKEVEYTIKLIRAIYPIIEEGFNLDSLVQEDNNQLVNFGKSIDDATANTKLLLTDQVIRNVLQHYINKVEFGEELDNILNITYSSLGENVTVLDQALNNIYSQTSVGIDSWQNEFAIIKRVLKADFEGTTLREFGAILDNLSGSKILTKDVVNKVVFKYIDDEVESMPAGLAEAINNMKETLDRVSKNDSEFSYELEFDYISQLVEVINASYGNDRLKFEAIGQQLNKLTNVTGAEETQSKVFVKAVVNDFITFYFNDFVGANTTIQGDLALKNIVNSVLNNLNDITNYKLELTNIFDIVECFDSSIPDKNNDGEGSLSDIGFVLDEICSSSAVKPASNLITTSVIRSLINYYLNKETLSLPDGLKLIVEDIKTTVSDLDIRIDSYENEFDCLNLLTEQITALTLNYTNIGTAFDTICSKNSVMLSRSVLNDMLNFYLNDFVETNLNTITDSGLINIILGIPATSTPGIVDNIANITSFQAEFTHIKNLFDVISNPDKSVVGSTLDNIRNASKLFTKQNINDIVLYYFDKEVTEKSISSDYASIINEIRGKIASAVYNSNITYVGVFTEFETLSTYLNDFATINSLEDFTNPTGVGAKLDEMEDMSNACDKEITYEVASTLINILLDAVDEEYPGMNISSTIQTEIINNSVYSFNTYNTANFVGTYYIPDGGTTYYASMFSAIKNRIDEIIPGV